MTSLIAAKSNPAVLGIFGPSGVSNPVCVLSAVGVREGDTGVGAVAWEETGDPSRGGRSSTKVD